MYHRVSATARPNRYTVSASEFEQQMLSLQEMGNRVISLAETVQALNSSDARVGSSVCITFDDGFQDTHSFAAPVLKRLRYPATFFLVSGLMGSTNRWDNPETPGFGQALMDWDEAKDLSESGFDIGSHSLTHPVLPEVALARAAREICASKEELERQLGIRVRHFAYPYGRFNQSIRDLVCEAGYQAACSTLSGFANHENDRFALRRIEIFGGDSLRTFRRKLKFGANEMGSRAVMGYYARRALARCFGMVS
jgi:peptidoglycan/xylan/chitin deacetylase (PgdA/CDA1 family)